MEKSEKLMAGAGRAEISLPEEVFPTEKFIGVRDPIHVRVLLFSQNEPAALVAVEMTALPKEECETLRAIVAEETGIPGGQIWVYVTHTFSAPHIPPLSDDTDADAAERRLKISAAMQDAARAAAKQAAARMAPVRLGVSRGSCDININKDIDTAQGVWLGMNPDGVSNKEVTVLCLEGGSGQPAAVLFHYGVQASVMEHCELSSGGQLVTSDLAGKAAEVVESAFGPDCVALFLPGPCGDQSPRKKGRYFAAGEDGLMEEVDFHEDGFSFIDQLGEELGSAVVNLVNGTANTQDDVKISCLQRDYSCSGQVKETDVLLHGPRSEHVFEPAEDVTLTIYMMRIGETALVGVRPELNCITGLQLQQRSPCAVTLPVQTLYGGQKCLPDRESYGRITYEARNSGFACGSAEQFVEWSLELLNTDD